MNTEMTLPEIENEIRTTENRLEELRNKREAIVAAWVASLSPEERLARLRTILPSALVDAMSGQRLTEHDNLLISHALMQTPAVRAAEISGQAGAPDLTGLLRRKILSLSPAQLSWVSSRQYTEMLGLAADRTAEVEEALVGLAAEEAPLVRRFWFIEGSDDDVIEVPDEDIEAWKAGEALAHPETGEEIPHPERILHFAWGALKRA